MLPPCGLHMIFCTSNDFSRLKLALRHIRRFPEIFRCIASMSNWWEVTSAYVGLARSSLPFEARFRNGMRHRFEEFYDLETLWQIFFHRVMSVRPSDRVIIDAGANIGLFACYATGRSRLHGLFALSRSRPHTNACARLYGLTGWTTASLASTRRLIRAREPLP